VLFNWANARAALGALSLGMLVTIFLTITCGATSLVAGVFVALAKMSKRRILRFVVGSYVTVMRATPLLVQLIFIYYSLPFVGIRLSPLLAGYVGLSLNLTAYLSEVYRGGIEAVSKGQHDAAAAIGMRPSVAMARVIFPQAFKSLIPTLGNYMVALFKDTSLASAVTIQELMFKGQIVAAQTYDYMTIYTMVFVMYLIVGYPAIRIVILLEKRMKYGYARNKKMSKETSKTDREQVIL
jgi:His/Glu/Gln/Arg/opine family amino acid ABC transporter permease subunit